MSKVTPEQLQQRRAETLELINAEITDSLARQSDSGAKIDTKAIVLVGYAGAASSFLATRHAQPVLAALDYAAYAAAAGFGIWAYAVRLYQDVPTPRNLFNAYVDRNKADVVAALAAARVPAFEGNASKHRRKARRWWISIVSLAAGVTLMLSSVTVAAHTDHHDRRSGSGRAIAAVRHRPSRAGPG